MDGSLERGGFFYIMEYHISTNDVGLARQIVDMGKQYRVKVRVINHCNPECLTHSCFSYFTWVHVLMVRARVKSSNEATISIAWFPPIDNGQSPTTGYLLFMKDYDGIISSFESDHEMASRFSTTRASLPFSYRGDEQTG
jgi:hypothetical protein